MGRQMKIKNDEEAVLNNKDVAKEPKVKERVGDSVNAVPSCGMISHAWSGYPF